MTDKVYRRYVCNLEAPYIKCRTLTCQTIESNSIPTVYGTVIEYSLSHSIRNNVLPVLTQNFWNATMTVFLKSEDGTHQSVVMCVLYQLLGQNAVPVIYQTVGNIKVDISWTSSGGNHLIITSDIPTRLDWTCSYAK